MPPDRRAHGGEDRPPLETSADAHRHHDGDSGSLTPQRDSCLSDHDDRHCYYDENSSRRSLRKALSTEVSSWRAGLRGAAVPPSVRASRLAFGSHLSMRGWELGSNTPLLMPRCERSEPRSTHHRRCSAHPAPANSRSAVAASSSRQDSTERPPVSSAACARPYSGSRASMMAMRSAMAS